MSEKWEKRGRDLFLEGKGWVAEFSTPEHQDRFLRDRKLAELVRDLVEQRFDVGEYGREKSYWVSWKNEWPSPVPERDLRHVMATFLVAAKRIMQEPEA